MGSGVVDQSLASCLESETIRLFDVQFDVFKLRQQALQKDAQLRRLVGCPTRRPEDGGEPLHARGPLNDGGVSVGHGGVVEVTVGALSPSLVSGVVEVPRLVEGASSVSGFDTLKNRGDSGVVTPASDEEIGVLDGAHLFERCGVVDGVSLELG